MEDDNTELDLAWEFIEKTSTNLFLTGKAGTGKTTFLRKLKDKSAKRMIVLAPTGIAAINAGGVTIHSFLQLPLAPFVPETTYSSAQVHYHFSKEKRNIIRSTDLIVIDEISMVRADLLDAMDNTLRRYRQWDKPFGGVQLLMIGDLQQLAPVTKNEEWELLKRYYATPYFFSSRALRETNYMTIELNTVYRQQDTYFLSILNKIRENKADDMVLNELNRRYVPNFHPKKEDGYIRLTTHNYQAQQINDYELSLLSTPSYSFISEVEGIFPEYSYPADERLTVKEGAQIMFLKNDTSYDKRYYNGLVGEVLKVSNDCLIVRAKGSQQAFQLEKEEWQNSKYALDEKSKEITEVVEGTFKQYPIRLAWAITIHKSQGLTFDRAIIDVRHSFAHGQTYVALSRCRTLEGIVLESPVQRSAIITDEMVDKFTKEVEQKVPDKSILNDLEKAYSIELLHDLFNLRDVDESYRSMLRLIDEHLYKQYPSLLESYKSKKKILKDLMQVADRFEVQYRAILSANGGDIEDNTLQERIRSAAGYFGKNIEPLIELHSLTQLVSNNKLLQKQIKEHYKSFGNALNLKVGLFAELECNDSVFTISWYLNSKARLMLNSDEEEKVRKERKKKEKKEKEKKIKVCTKEISYDLYCSGMTIEEIAQERNLVPGTIVTHLIPYIINGDIKIDALVDRSIRVRITNFALEHPDKMNSLMAIKENVEDNISYTDIKLVMASLGVAL